MDIDSLIAEEFELDPRLVYLNHAAVAPWPRRARLAVERFAADCTRHGAQHYPRWLAEEQRLRERLARLVNAPGPQDIALVKNTSEGLSFVASGLDWQPGDEVVTSDEEFPSNRMPWQALAPRGVRLREVTLGLGEAPSPEQRLISACSERTRVLAVSSVQYASGLRMDLPQLGRFCREHGILFCVDAIQQVGALDLDVQAACVDVAVADGHKWMLGPEGLALFYTTPEARERIAVSEWGWHMTDAPGDFDRRDWRPAGDARRYECGSPNLLGAHALSASVGVLLDAGMATVEARVLAHSRLLTEALVDAGARLRSPLAAERRSGIVTFVPPDGDAEAAFRRLTEAGVVCALRGGGVRFSPHFHTRVDDLERALGVALGG